MRTVITKPGEIIDFETVFEENPDFGTEPKRVGTTLRVDYTTDVYEDGLVHPKYCYVYLPYCYDPEDKSRKYNVLYYQHGNTCEPEIFAEGANKKLLDNLFDNDVIEPCIIVSTTYYFDLITDRETRKQTGMVPAGDGGYEACKPNFWIEVLKDIIPAVETRFNTWLEEPTPEGIKASRAHRAFSGYSRGSVFTWRMFHYGFEAFQWFAPMSCHTTADHSVFSEIPKEDVLAYVTDPIKQHPELPFFVYASNGGPEDVVKMTEQMKYITKQPEFSYGKDPKVNNLYFSVSDYRHTDLLVPYYYYNSLQVLFKD